MANCAAIHFRLIVVSRRCRAAIRTLRLSVIAGIHMQRLVAPGEQVSAFRVANVNALGVNAQEPFHSHHQVGPGRFQHQMKMIAHQAIGMNLPGGFATRLGQGGQEQRPIAPTAEDGLPPIPSIHHVINRPHKLAAHLAWHASESLPKHPQPCQLFK